MGPRHRSCRRPGSGYVGIPVPARDETAVPIRSLWRLPLTELREPRGSGNQGAQGTQGVQGTKENCPMTTDLDLPTGVAPTPLALLLLGREADPGSERGVECPGDLPAASDPGLVDRARRARAALGERAFILGHHYQRDEVIQFADVTGDSFKLAREA